MEIFKNNNNYLLRIEKPSDRINIERLYDQVFGKNRFKRSVYLFRKGNPIESLCLVIEENKKNPSLLACIRYWPIKLGNVIGLLLGPLAVRNELRGYGLGKTLVEKSLEKASKEKWFFCFVSGEKDYYPRFGFEKINVKNLVLPKPIDPDRLHIKYFEAKKNLTFGELPWSLKKV